MKELATILSDAMYKGKRVMWVDHHNSSVLAVKEYPEIKALCGNYLTEYKISSAMQIYIGTLFVKSECGDIESVKEFTDKNVLKNFVRLASCYDTFTDISSDAIKLNDDVNGRLIFAQIFRLQGKTNEAELQLVKAEEMDIKNLAQVYTKAKYTRESHLGYSQNVLNCLKERNFLKD
jgi:hypothetical protein